MHRVPLFYRMTDGIRISARPRWVREQSDPGIDRFVFAYRIRIENSGSQGVRLLTRRWRIHDDAAGDSEVEGPGVVGEQPHLSPGQVHEYESFCVLAAPSGYLEGTYHFVRDDGTGFDAAIPRFQLEAQD